MVIGFVGSLFLSLLGMTLVSILLVNDALPLGNPGDEMHNHVGLVFGALAPALANTTAFTVVVILVKVLWDIRLHRKERHMFANSRAA